MENKTYKGIDLLEKILEFVEMTPNPNDWNLAKLSSNPPRKIRFRQIESLITAFFRSDENQNIFYKILSSFDNKKNTNIQSILSGEFIKLKTIDNYKTTIEFIKNQINNLNTEKEITVEELVFIYSRLTEYKKKLRALVTFNSNWLMVGSIPASFTIHITDSISNNLTNKYKDLDKALELIINPNELIFTKEQLIRRFNYPIDNLVDVDYEYM
jgi:hypothetical protein